MTRKSKPLSQADRAKLARSVGKYGRKAIENAVKKVRPARRGRKPADDKWEDVIWIEERRDELKAEGVLLALQKATAERYVKSVPKNEQTDKEFKLYEKRMKNRRDEWSKVKRRIKGARANRPNNVNRISRRGSV